MLSRFGQANLRDMQGFARGFLCGVLLLGLIAPGRAEEEFSSRAFREMEGRRPWYSFRRPARKTPGAQLEHARQLREQGSRRSAASQYRALVASWPASPEAALAQYELGLTEDSRGRLLHAFEAYAEALEKYGAALPYDRILDRQLDIAREIMNRRVARWLFGGFEDPGKAVPLLEKLLELAPASPTVPEVRFLIGQAWEAGAEWAPAITAYTQVVFDHADSPWAVEAAYRRAMILYNLSRRSPNDGRILDDAGFALSFFTRNYPQDPRVDEARDLNEDIQARRARHAFAIAAHYDRARKRDAALSVYRSFLERFPHAQQVDLARQRIAELAGPEPETTP